MINRVLRKVKNIGITILGEAERLILGKVIHVSTGRQAIEQWLFNMKGLPKIKGTVAITALRNYTWIEWSAYCATVLRTMGYKSTLIYKQSEIEELYRQPAYFNFWSAVKKIPDITLVNLEDLPFSDDELNLFLEKSNEMAVAALAYDYHIESSDIIDNPIEYEGELKKLKLESGKNGARIKEFFTKQKFHQFICYSGIIRDTSMILQGALDANQETVCVEGWSWRPGHMIYNFNAPSLEYNVKGWMNYFGKWDRDKENEMNKYSKFLDGIKQDSDWLNNFYMVQLAKTGEDLPSDIKKFVSDDRPIFLLACNVIGDSSMLNRETIFRSHKDFIEQTVSYFKTHTQYKLIIRIHPGEEWVTTKVKIKLGAFSKDLLSDNENIHVIDSNVKINTFSLIPFVKAGLVWISSVGVDMVVRGVPVISTAKPKYHGLGVVEEPKSIEEYFRKIEELANKQDVTPSKEQIVKAKEYLYLVFKGFSFEAMGRNFRANTYKFGNMKSKAEHDRLYRILVKEEPSPDSIGLNE